jgi:hypothetical protein
MKLIDDKTGQTFSTAERLMILGLALAVLVGLATMGWQLLDRRSTEAAAFESGVGGMADAGF